MDNKKLDDWQLLERELERSRAESTALRKRNVEDDLELLVESLASSPCSCVSPGPAVKASPVFGNDKSSNLSKNRG